MEKDKLSSSDKLIDDGKKPDESQSQRDGASTSKNATKSTDSTNEKLSNDTHGKNEMESTSQRSSIQPSQSSKDREQIATQSNSQTMEPKSLQESTGTMLTKTTQNEEFGTSSDTGSANVQSGPPLANQENVDKTEKPTTSKDGEKSKHSVLVTGKKLYRIASRKKIGKPVKSSVTSSMNNMGNLEPRSPQQIAESRKPETVIDSKAGAEPSKFRAFGSRVGQSVKKEYKKMLKHAPKKKSPTSLDDKPFIFYDEGKAYQIAPSKSKSIVKEKSKTEEGEIKTKPEYVDTAEYEKSEPGPASKDGGKICMIPTIKIHVEEPNVEEETMTSPDQLPSKPLDSASSSESKQTPTCISFNGKNSPSQVLKEGHKVYRIPSSETLIRAEKDRKSNTKDKNPPLTTATSVSIDKDNSTAKRLLVDGHKVYRIPSSETLIHTAKGETSNTKNMEPSSIPDSSDATMTGSKVTCKFSKAQKAREQEEVPLPSSKEWSRLPKHTSYENVSLLSRKQNYDKRLQSVEAEENKKQTPTPFASVQGKKVRDPELIAQLKRVRSYSLQIKKNALIQLKCHSDSEEDSNESKETSPPFSRTFGSNCKYSGAKTIEESPMPDAKAPGVKKDSKKKEVKIFKSISLEKAKRFPVTEEVEDARELSYSETKFKVAQSSGRSSIDSTDSCDQSCVISSPSSKEIFLKRKQSEHHFATHQRRHSCSADDIETLSTFRKPSSSKKADGRKGTKQISREVEEVDSDENVNVHSMKVDGKRRYQMPERKKAEPSVNIKVISAELRRDSSKFIVPPLMLSAMSEADMEDSEAARFLKPLGNKVSDNPTAKIGKASSFTPIKTTSAELNSVAESEEIQEGSTEMQSSKGEIPKYTKVEIEPNHELDAVPKRPKPKSSDEELSEQPIVTLFGNLKDDKITKGRRSSIKDLQEPLETELSEEDSPSPDTETESEPPAHQTILSSISTTIKEERKRRESVGVFTANAPSKDQTTEGKTSAEPQSSEKSERKKRKSHWKKVKSFFVCGKYLKK